MAKAAAKRKKPAKPKATARKWPPLGLRASFEAQKAAGIGEERLLAYVAFACFAAFVVGLPAAIRAEVPQDLAGGAVGIVAGRFVAFVIFAPLFLYGLAALTHLIAARVFGGTGSYFDARFALFWALVLGLPLAIVNAAAIFFLEDTSLYPLVPWIGFGVFFAWLWIWTSLVAIAEGFSRVATFGLVCLGIFCVAGLVRLLAG